MSLYNLRNPAVKRLMKEAEELLHPTDEYHAQPVEDNLFEWHFTLKGPPNSDYEGGIYHGRITLPTEYPMKPPSIILLTPNGRFETNKKICLSISGHHPETWQPSWSIRTALLAIIGFMPTHGNGAIGSLDYTHEERQALAKKSQDWHCSECGYIRDIFLNRSVYRLNENVSCKESLNSQIIQTECNEVLISEDETKSSLENGTVNNEEETSLVHRHKSSSTQNEVMNKTLLVETEHKQNTFFTVFIFTIIAIIMFLSFRRLLSL